MSLKKPEHPLNASVLSLGALFTFYAVMSAATAILWSFAVNCAAATVGVFFIGAVLLLAYALYCLRQNSKRAVRDRLNIFTLLAFIPAVLILVAVELYGGYLRNTVSVSRNRLYEYFYKELDEEKLCTEFMSGANPQEEPFLSGKAEDILKMKTVPKFRGVYSGDFASSFSDGGKVYLKLGRYAVSQLKEAAKKGDSAEFVKYGILNRKVIAAASRAIRDPERAAFILADEYAKALQECVTANFPDDRSFEQLTVALADTREGFANNITNNIIYDTQAALNRYDALIKNTSDISRILNADLEPVWSDADLIAGRLFPVARRLRLTQDYAAGMEYLHSLRAVGTSVYSAGSKRIEALSKKLDEIKKQRHFVSLAFAPDIRRHIAESAVAQHRIENAYLACEIELFRRQNKRMPKNFEELHSLRLTGFPDSIIDGSKYTLLKGRFNDKSGKEYSGYALNVPTGSFVITDRK